MQIQEKVDYRSWESDCIMNKSDLKWAERTKFPASSAKWWKHESILDLPAFYALITTKKMP